MNKTLLMECFLREKKEKKKLFFFKISRREYLKSGGNAFKRDIGLNPHETVY